MGKENKKGLTSAIQEGLVSLILYGDAKDANAVLALVPSKAFSPYYKEIVKTAETYLETYKKTPADHSWDLIEELSQQAPDKKSQYLHIYDSILETKAGINREYILGKAKVFARKQNQLAIVQKILPLLSRDDDKSIEEVDALMAGSTRASIDLSDPGILFNDPQQALRFLNAERMETFPTGIPELDACGAGPARKKYMLIVAETNTGKSWSAIHLGKTALMHGYKVLHITLEMDEDEVSQRYVQMFASVGKRESNVLMTHFEKDSLGRISNLIKGKVKRPTLKDDKIYAKLVKKLTPLKGKPKLYIKEFPSGTLSVSRLKAFMDHLEAVRGYTPDMLIIDMPDLLEHSAQNKRNELEKIAVDCRGIAGARNIAVVGFSQVNEQKTGKVIKTGRTHEGRAKEHTADIEWSLNQTPDEYEMGLMRIHIAKSRNDRKGFTVLISQALGAGQFVIDSAEMIAKSYWAMLDENGGGNAEEKE